MALWTLVLTVTLGFTSISGINLDARFSVIKKGKDNSYFGFSVAQHQILDGNNEVLHNVLLVGAPKEMRPINNNMSNVIGGALYRCISMDKSESCTIITEGLSNEPVPGELVSDQWLGVSVVSAGPGKKAAACAHRYIKDNAALGFCLVMDNELLEPAKYSPCDKLPKTRYMADFGLCQAGMSALAGQDDAFVMGAPGSVFWQGVVFMTNITDELGVSTAEILSPYNDKNRLTGNEQASPTAPYSYNGYAVAVGRFDSSRVLYYASGAPKSHNKGEVIFFKQLKTALYYEPSQIIRGPMDFSGFGSSLLAMDLNKDGFDDLIVGAPYYYRRGHGGAFYIYYGGVKMISNSTVGKEIISRSMGDQECERLMCEHAQFGISLSKIGDVNKDTFQDFAVGAPYEGKGCVYIYFGSDKPIDKYVQRIEASDLPVPNLMSFGYSLSGGLDLDDNGYPDLLVGAYESSAVVLLRSRPIIKLNSTLKVNPIAVNLEEKAICTSPLVKPANAQRHCIEIELCLSFYSKSGLSTMPTVTYNLEAEPQRRIARVDIQDKAENKAVTLKASGQQCVKELALVKAQFDDKLNPMEFRFTFGLSTDNRTKPVYPDSAVANIDQYPVLEIVGKGTTDVVKVEFVKECGEDNECDSNLQFSASYKGLIKKDDVYEMAIGENNNLFVEIDVQNIGEAAYLTRVYLEKPKTVSYFSTESLSSVTCQNVKDDDTLIVCDQIGNPFRQNSRVYFIIKLSVPSNLSETNDVYNITTWVNTTSTESTPLNDRHVLKFRVINKAEIILQPNVIPDSPILCKGEPRKSVDFTDEKDIGASVKHNFVVRNLGPGVVPNSYISIKWPYQLKGAGDNEEKYLLYLTRMPKTVGPVKCIFEDIQKFINPKNIKLIEEASAESVLSNYVADVPPEFKESSRKKRQADRERRAPGSVVVMSCEKEDIVDCFELKCEIGKLDPNQNYAQITFEARLWESTLLSNYRKTADVQIISWAKVDVPEKITQDTKNDVKGGITRAVPDFKETAGQTVQWWIILVAVLVGLVVLLVVIFVLYKLGFFRRKRLEDMKTYKAEKKQQAMLSDQDEA
ncbi:integrin alpha-PS1-like isoform X1 [Physella acuta]|uniref:integrin alpha-PS1-like isoform X1 n=1 Tax=Physella acuta TaxID=109671 RepID=UPI0027DBFA4E|nr:integrin alpha-PS1-like isoform X1 [Physella acuta]